ncbi:MAG: hypothetical protein AAB556_02585 [Patescibacteria group bacterium]|mgnify:FL=1
MKKIPLLIAIVMLLMVFFKFGLTAKPTAEQVTGYLNGNSIKYAKDSRTNTCFAYTAGWAGAPANLAYTPCESIPKNLLYVF